MPTYVIDADRGLWRIDRDAADDFDSVPVERQGTTGSTELTTARLRWADVVVDPTDQELADLEPKELARFGMTRELLVG